MLTLVAASAVLTLDVVSKHFVRALRGRAYRVVPGLQIRRVHLVRPAFLRRRGRAGLIVSWHIAMICAVVLTVSDRAFHTAAAQLGLGAALGGGLGNLIDVLRRQAITDFLDLGWWPVFNFADVAIVGGLIFALWPMV